MARKPKTNYANQPERDRCQTPPYALQPLWSVLNWPGQVKTIWEPCAGEGYLVAGMRLRGYAVIESDVLDGFDFLTDTYTGPYDVIITNPPFSLKYKFLKRCYEIGKPFALLMPTDVIGAATAIKLFVAYGVEIIQVFPRVNYKMPNKGWDGQGAQFPSAWFTWGLNIGRQLSFYNLKMEVPHE